MKIPIRHGDYKKFMALYLLAFLAVILLTIAFSFAVSFSSLTRSALSANQAMLRQTENSIESKLQVIDRETINLEEQPGASAFMDNVYPDEFEQNMGLFSLSRSIDFMMNANDNIHSTYLYSETTGRLISNQNLYENAQIPDTSWMESYRKNAGRSDAFWLTTRPVSSGTAGSAAETANTRYVISLIRSYPLYSTAGYRKGCVVVNVDESTIYQTIRSALTKSEGTLIIADASGTVISSSDSQLRLRNLAGLAYMKTVLGGDSGLIRNLRVGQKTADIFYRTSAYTGWKYVGVIPRYPSGSSLTMTRNIMLAIAGVMLLFGAAIVIAVSRLAYRPIDRFVGVMTRRIQPFNGEGANEDHDVLDHIEKSIDRILQEHEAASRQIRENASAIRWRLIHDLLSGNYACLDEILRQLERIGVSLTAADYLVLVAEIDNTEIVRQKLSGRELGLYQYALGKVAEEFVQQQYRGTACLLGDTRVVILLNFETGDQKANTVCALSIAETIAGYFASYFELTATIGVGKYSPDPAHIQQSYLTALSALKYKLIFGCGTVISQEDILGSRQQRSNFQQVFSQTDAVLAALRSAEPEAISAHVSRLFDEVRALPPDLIRQIALNLLFQSLHVAVNIGLDDGVLSDTSRSRISDTFARLDTVEQMRDYVLAEITGLAAQIQTKRGNRSNRETMARVEQYIHAHHTEDGLTLYSVADAFHLSTPYLSKIFKENAGANFTEYLMTVRMENAKKELAASDRKVSEIAKMVGYPNPHSFIRIFKKYTGNTPGEYRDRVRLPSGRNPAQDGR